MLVIGAREMQANVVSVRVHGKANLGAKPQSAVRQQPGLCPDALVTKMSLAWFRRWH